MITFVTTMVMGVSLLLLINDKRDVDKEGMQVGKNMGKPVKREAKGEDIIKIVQVIEMKDKKFLCGITIDPVLGKVIVEKIDEAEVKKGGLKTMEEIYDYGGIRMLIKEINKRQEKKYDRYVVIEGEYNLMDMLNVVGSIEIEGELYKKIRKITQNESQIINGERFLDILEMGEEDVILEIVRLYFKQKILLLEGQRGEEIFKSIINLIDSDISYKDFKNLTEIDLKKLAEK